MEKDAIGTVRGIIYYQREKDSLCLGRQLFPLQTNRAIGDGGEFSEKKVGTMNLLERRKMVEPGHALSLVSQSALLGLHRSGLYYRPVTVDEEDLTLMALLDRQYLKTPFYGYRKMTMFLQGEGYPVNHKRVRRWTQMHTLWQVRCG